MKYIIGIDAGESRINAILYDVLGHEINQVTAYIDPEEKGGMDMERYYSRTVSAVRRLIRQSDAEAEAVCAIGITGSDGGLWPVDKTGAAFMPACLKKEKWAEKDAFSVNTKTPGIGLMLHKAMGTPAEAGSTLMLLKWLKANDTSFYHRIDRIMSLKDWLRYCFTGIMATDPSDGALSLMRFGDARPAEQVYTVLGLAELSKKTVPVRESTALCGGLSEKAAGAMGLKVKTPVVTGACRKTAQAVGSGAVTERSFAVVLDETVSACGVLRSGPLDVTRSRKHYVRHAESHLMLNAEDGIGGMENIDWMMREIARTSNRRTVENMIAEEAQGCGGLIYYPYRSGETNVSGSYFGMNAAATKGRLMRAVYEGTAFGMRECLETMGTRSELLLTGKGAESLLLPQMIADITGLKTVTFQGSNPAARGAAILAATGIGIFGSLSEAVVQFCRVRQVLEPVYSQAYEQSYQRYQQLKAALEFSKLI